MIVKVALNIPYTQPYDYQVTEFRQNTVSPGLRVLVPVGARKMIGVVVGVQTESDIKQLKSVLSFIDQDPVYSPGMLAFTHWISNYYLCSWGEVLDAALPTSLKPKLTKSIEVDRGKLAESLLNEEERTRLEFVNGKIESDVFKQAKKEGWERFLANMKKKKVIRSTYSCSVSTAGLESQEWLFYQDKAGDGLTVRKGSLTSQVKDLLKSVSELPLRSVLEQIPKARPAINKLVSRGVLSRKNMPTPLASCPSTINEQLFIQPNDEQLVAISEMSECIQREQYQTFLLHGVTGSGKTEIYLHVVKETVQQGKTALILIPEISLTPQVVSRFRERFGERIAVLHSGMADGERARQWWKIKQGGCDIVVGARSAIFAPLENIGLIVVDEEHDTSFKQQESPYYNARDAAVKRASDNNCIVILGSATPSVESYFNVKEGKYRLLELTRRVNQQRLPVSELINLKEEKRQKGAFYLSRYLVNQLKDNLQAGKQALIFLNRRGYAAFLSCAACEQPILCRNCSIAMTWHRTRQKLICHHCGFSQAYPTSCPNCQERTFRLEGVGTQRVERDLKLLFPEARFLRMDRDTVRRRGALERNIDKINDQQVDFIIGTQLISKGHDFKHIGIVCMIFADMSLNIPDFRSSERSFQLISQVSGRAGRNEDNSGLALIQSYNPGHYAFQTAVNHDFQGFYNQEMMLRHDLQNPPLLRQILIKISSPNPRHAEQSAMDLGGILRNNDSEVDFKMMGPVEAPLQKINNRYYWQILLKSEEINRVKGVIRGLMFQRKGWRGRSGTRVAIDVDPMTML